MRDSIDRSSSALGLLARVVAGLAVLVIVPPVACVGLHHLRHPAPLGRSTGAILAHIDAALPSGTSEDSARRFLHAHGATVSGYTAAEAPRWYAHDTLWARGAVLNGRLPSVTRDLYVWDGFVTLYFTPAGTLARREAHLSAVNPL